MPNMKQLIMAHSRKMLDTEDKERRVRVCKKQECLVNRSCLIVNIFYKATVTTENRERVRKARVTL